MVFRLWNFSCTRNDGEPVVWQHPRNDTLYSAPELISTRTSAVADADGRQDVWALGALLLELAVGRVEPFGEKEGTTVSGKMPKLKTFLNSVADKREAQFLASLLHESPQLRPTVVQACKR